MMVEDESASAHYKRFEDKFRGSRAVVKARLGVYAPFLDAISEHVGAAAQAVDIGCGRGEWLEVLRDHGWRPVGVDLNEDMIAEAKAEGLDARNADALAFLNALPAGSLGLVSAMHVVEHVPQTYLRDLTAAAFRALRPGGLLIFETPNPENVSVASWSFHLDPSHLAPLPPELLAFLVRDAGFETVEIMTLNGAPAAPGQGPVEEMVWTLFTAGPDYAVVAVKAREDGGEGAAVAGLAARLSQARPGNITHVTALARAADQSTTGANAAVMDRLEAIYHAARHHDQLFSAQIDRLQREVSAQAELGRHHEQLIAAQVDAVRRDAIGFAEAARSQVAQVGVELRALSEAHYIALHHMIQHSAGQVATEVAALRARQAQLEQVNAEQAAQLVAMRASTSWRITAPLRGVGTLLAPRALSRRGRNVAKTLLRKPLEFGLRFGRRHPPVARAVHRLLGGVPWVGSRLRQFAQVRGYAVERRTLGGDVWRIDAPEEALADWRARLGRPMGLVE